MRPAVTVTLQNFERAVKQKTIYGVGKFPLDHHILWLSAFVARGGFRHPLGGKRPRIGFRRDPNIWWLFSCHAAGFSEKKWEIANEAGAFFRSGRRETVGFPESKVASRPPKKDAERGGDVGTRRWSRWSSRLACALAWSLGWSRRPHGRRYQSGRDAIDGSGRRNVPQRGAVAGEESEEKVSPG